MQKKSRSGVAIASAAALLFGSTLGAPAFADEAAKVKCEGANACKGQSACHTAKNSCAGANSCKGQGFLELTQADCDAAKAKMAEPAQPAETPKKM